ncbi:MAG: hypothetical protein ACJ77N_05245 [Chloroflexota bacterium]
MTRARPTLTLVVGSVITAAAVLGVFQLTRGPLNGVLAPAPPSASAAVVASAASPSPSSPPSVASSPSSSTSSTSPSASSPSAAPSASAGATHPETFATLVLPTKAALGGLRVDVVDASDHLSLAHLVRLTTNPGQGLQVRAVPGDAKSVDLGWLASICDYRNRLSIAGDLSTITLDSAPRPGCDAVGVGAGIRLTFDRPVGTVPAGAIRRGALVKLADLQPRTVTFVDALHGWVGGTTAAGDAIVAETADAGKTWKVGGLGWGSVTAIGVVGDKRWAVVECGAITTCKPGVSRGTDTPTSWERPAGSDFTQLVGLDATTALAIERTADGTLDPDRRQQVVAWDTDHATAHSVANPCPKGLGASDVDTTSAEALVLCLGQGAGQAEEKQVYASTDRGSTWRLRASSDAGGSMPRSGAGVQLAVANDGTGWLWGSRVPLQQVTGAAKSFRPVAVADGEVRVAFAGSALPRGSGYVLVRDEVTNGVLLLFTDSGGVKWHQVAGWAAG